MRKTKSFAFALVIAFAAGCYVPPDPTTADEEQALPEDGCGANRHREDDVDQVCTRKGFWSSGTINASNARCNGDNKLICTYQGNGTCQWSDPKKVSVCVSGEPACPPPGDLIYNNRVTREISLKDGDTTCDPQPPENDPRLKDRCIDLMPPDVVGPMKKACENATDVQKATVSCCVTNPPPPPPQCLEDEYLVCNLDGSCICVAQSQPL